MSFLSGLFSGEARELGAFKDLVGQITASEPRVEALSDEDLRAEFLSLKKQHQDGVSLDDLRIPAFALVREAARRTLGQRHYDVQLIGALTLHAGMIPEMRTGEGKTLAATPAVALNALTGRGVHVVTVNDYLSKRDASWMGQIYHALGLSVGCIAHESSYIYDPAFAPVELTAEEKLEESFRVEERFLRPVSRQDAYAADITYGTNNEYGFDYLRDNLEIDPAGIRQRDHAFAIVDEVDSILIDEARTPLIISQPDEDSADLYKLFSGLVPKLTPEAHFTVDEKLKAVSLTEEGIEKVEELLGMKDIYTEHGIRYVRHLEQALRAHVLFKRDRDYVVKNGEIIIVDEFTGRMMPGRRWSDGLHQAVEAREGVAVRSESRTIASVTFQNFFRMYDKLAGMTGTAKSAEEEFENVYGLRVLVIPTNKPAIREDRPDAIYQNTEAKWKAVAQKIKELQAAGRPVLVGTVSITRNEYLSELLSRTGVKHEVLNAKNHEREAEIIAQAGRAGAVTVATNLAGRGVDILLGGNPPDADEAARVREAGGLFVLGTERHEARRIDDQLRGRAGRQGDPGGTQFFLSLEDDLVRVFANDRVKGMMKALNVPESEPIESKMVSNAIVSAQARIEGFNFDARKHVLDYDNVLARQRDAVYKDRREVLLGKGDVIWSRVEPAAHMVASRLASAHHEREDEDKTVLALTLSTLIGRAIDEGALNWTTEGLAESIAVLIIETAQDRKETEGEAFLERIRVLYLRVVDELWQHHLEGMEYLRNSVRLRAYGQRDPLVEYKNEAIRMYRALGGERDLLFIEHMFRADDDARQTTPAVVMASAPTGEKVGRNDDCPCGAKRSDGSPIKYKHCHGK